METINLTNLTHLSTWYMILVTKIAKKIKGSASDRMNMLCIESNTLRRVRDRLATIQIMCHFDATTLLIKILKIINFVFLNYLLNFTFLLKHTFKIINYLIFTKLLYYENYKH